MQSIIVPSANTCGHLEMAGSIPNGAAQRILIFILFGVYFKGVFFSHGRTGVIVLSSVRDDLLVSGSHTNRNRDAATQMNRV